MDGLITHMIVVCLLLYVSIMDHGQFLHDIVLVITTLSWIGLSLVFMLTLSIAGALVNSMVRLDFRLTVGQA